MKKPAFIYLTLVLFTFSACGKKTDKSDTNISENTQLLYATGDSIAVAAQSLLMSNVSQAIREGGTEYAVEFCNLEAIPLTDSVAQRYNVQIQRLSDKNRNPDNALVLKEDIEAWEELKSGRKTYIRPDEEGRAFFYKPIILAMETCLNCHGGKNDISESTLAVISQKYPNDKATGYALGDLRGMWKIRLQE